MLLSSLSPFVRESRFRNPENFCLWNPGSGKVFANENRNPGLWNPELSSRNPGAHLRLESGIISMEYGNQNIQDCLGFPFKGQSLATANVTSKKQEFVYDALLTKQA